MDKNKKSRTSNFKLGKTSKAELPSNDEINKVVAKITDKNIETETKKVKRIPFTTAINPDNRAYLEAASHEGRGSVADILNFIISNYFTEINPIVDKEILSIYKKIYKTKKK